MCLCVSGSGIFRQASQCPFSSSMLPRQTSEQVSIFDFVQRMAVKFPLQSYVCKAHRVSDVEIHHEVYSALLVTTERSILPNIRENYYLFISSSLLSSSLLCSNFSGFDQCLFLRLRLQQ
jgi:hypothetical protein